MEKYLQELELLREYMRFRINMLAAVYGGSHVSPYFPSIRIRTTLWKSQIMEFEDWKKHRPSVAYHMISVK